MSQGERITQGLGTEIATAGTRALPTRGLVVGLAVQVPAGSHLQLLDGGRRVAVADCSRLTIYDLEADGDVMSARAALTYELPGVASALTQSSLGPVVALERDSASAVALVTDAGPTVVHECTGRVTSLTASGAFAFIVESGGDAPALVRISLRQRSVMARVRLDHPDVRVEPDDDGGVLVTDRRARTITVMTRELREPDPYRGHPSCDDGEPSPGSCSCSPSRKVPEIRERGADQGRGGGSRCGCHDCGRGTPTDHTPGPCDPSDESAPPRAGGSGGASTGDVAVPSPGGGRVVGDGSRVEHHPPAGSGRRPCGLSVFYTVEDLRRIGGYFLATDASGRRMSLLSQDMNLIDEWSSARGGTRVLTSPDSTTMLSLRSGESTWRWTDVHLLADELRPDLRRYVVDALTPKTFIGQQTYPLSYGQPTKPTKIKAIVLPVIEGAQSFTSPDLGGFTAYLRRVMQAAVRDYYDENSYGQLTDVTVDVFGGNVGPVGRPLTLPRTHLADYYFPTYDPARVELKRAGLTGTEVVEFDGRESLVIQATPLTGGPTGKSLTITTFALGLRREIDLYPAQVKFLGTERLTLDVTLPDGAAKTLTLTFPAKTIDITDQGQVATKLAELATYLDGVMAAAEAAAGIATRVFAAPKATRIPAVGVQFGSLVVTWAAASKVGGRLRVRSSSSLTPGGDPLALGNALRGVMPITATARLARYLDVATLLAQEAAGAGYNARLLEPPTVTLTSGTLTTAIPISKRYGGPGASVTLTSSAELGGLFTTATAVPNSATTDDAATALRDRGELYQDALSAAVQRLRAAQRPTNLFETYTCVLILPVEPAAPLPGDPEAVLPTEAWNVTALHRPFVFRGAENVTTVIDKTDPSVQVQSAWALVFMAGGRPDTALIVHEIGHAIGFGDLYYQNGYRDELAYLGSWAMMDSHPGLSHHCGYHKLQAQWIPDGAGTENDYGRVLPLGLPKPDQVRTWEFLLVPIELWRDSLVNSARAAFGMDSATPVVQLGWIDLGGDGATFGLIEARQPGARFSRHLPAPGAGILITNGIAWTLDERFATNGWYRRPVQWLNPHDQLRNPGDSFDLARAPELAVKGLKVSVVDTKLVEGDAQVYRVKVTRENAAFVDLYFENPPVYYKNPDLWVDWQGNNKPGKSDLVPKFEPGSPSDQGEAIRVPAAGFEPHWVVARIRNRGKVKATDVKFNFFYFEPPGGGDGRKPMDVNNLSAYRLIGSTTLPEVPGEDAAQLVLQPWDVPAGFGGHTCLLVQIEDYRIPEDAAGAVLGSDDVWLANNHAQKNVDKYEALKSSPFTPLDFEFSVRNEGTTPEIAYLEPDGLPYGMTLTVTPAIATIPAASTVRFQCRLTLDDAIIEAGCENDQRFRIHAWRQDPESSARWGGVEYEIRPRQRTQVTLSGSWDYSNTVEFTGKVTPDPGGGTVRIRVEFTGQQAQWMTTTVTAGGAFRWKGRPPSGSYVADGVAWFEGNRTFGSARSQPARTQHPPIVR